MDEEAVEEVLVCAIIRIIASSCVLYESTNTKSRRKRKCWVKDYSIERDQYGA